MNTKALWQDYVFLTNELEKFISRQNFEMVDNLLQQRETLQNAIDASQADDYLSSAEGQRLLEEISAKNRRMSQLLHLQRNKSQQRHTVANAYDRLGMNNTGFSMDSKT